MSNFALFVDRQATRMDQAVVRDALNPRPVAFPELIIGSSRQFRLSIVDGSNGLDAISGSAAVQPIVSIGSTCAIPTGGTWTFTRGANTTAALAYNIDAAALETAIEGLASVGSGNVSVKALPGNAYQIEYIGTLADTDIDDASTSGALLTPSSTATISRATEGGSGDNEVQIVRLQQVPFVLQASWASDGTGWTGTLSTGSWEALTAIAAQTPLVATLQVLIVLADGAVEKLALQPARILCDVSDPSQFVPAQFPTYLTAAQVNAFFADPFDNPSFDRERWNTRLYLPDAMVVEGAGSSSLDGVYLPDGDANGKPRYTPPNPFLSNVIFWSVANEWFVGVVTDSYTSTEDVATPDLVAIWNVGSSVTAPAPTVRRATWPEYIAALLEQEGATLADLTLATGATVGTIETNITDDDTHLPTSGAVVDYAQPLDADLTAIAGLTSAADKLPYYTGAGAAALADLTSAGRALLAEQNASAQRESIGLRSVSATLDFPSIAAGDTAELTIGVIGPDVGNAVQLAPPAAIESGLTWCGYVSGLDQITVRVANVTSSAIDPASATWGVIVTPLS